MDERLRWLQEQNLAYGLVLGCLVKVVWPDEAERGVAHDVCRDIVQRMYSEGLGSEGDRRIQGVLQELDGLFQIAKGVGRDN